MRFCPIPYEVLETFEGSELLLVVELYRRAHALRWRPFRVTHRSLGTRIGVHPRIVGAVLTELEALGLGIVEAGSRGLPTRLQIINPTGQASTIVDREDPPILNSKRSVPGSEGGSVPGSSLDQVKDVSTMESPKPGSVPGSEGGSDPGSVPGSLLLRSKNETREIDTEKEKRESKRGRSPASLDPTAPKWLKAWLKSDGRQALEAAGSIRAVFGALGRTLEGIRGKPGNVIESACRPVLRLWREMLAEGLELDGELSGLVDPVALLADACQRCGDPVFARDVRGEGWEGGRDRSRNVAAICRLAPREHSSGATWQERLEVARVWDAKGRPSGWELSPKSASSSAGPSYLQRLNAIASEGA